MCVGPKTSQQRPEEKARRAATGTVGEEAGSSDTLFAT